MFFKRGAGDPVCEGACQNAPPGHEAEIRRPGTDIWYLSHVPDKPSRGQLAQSELLYLGKLSIGFAVSTHRIGFEIVGHLLLEISEPHAEKNCPMSRVEPNRRFSHFRQTIRTRAVTHDSIMDWRAARIIDAPSDDGQMARCDFSLGAFDDLRARRAGSRRSWLSQYLTGCCGDWFRTG